MNLTEISQLLPNQTMGYLATVDENNAADLRGWQLQRIEGGKIYFTTSASKNVWKQIQNNPQVAFFCTVNGYTFRVYGKAIHIVDKSVIQKVYDKSSEDIKSMYPTIDSNGYTVFCLEHGRVAYAKGFGQFESLEF